MRIHMLLVLTYHRLPSSKLTFHTCKKAVFGRLFSIADGFLAGAMLVLSGAFMPFHYISHVHLANLSSLHLCDHLSTSWQPRRVELYPLCLTVYKVRKSAETTVCCLWLNLG